MSRLFLLIVVYLLDDAMHHGVDLLVADGRALDPLLANLLKDLLVEVRMGKSVDKILSMSFKLELFGVLYHIDLILI